MMEGGGGGKGRQRLKFGDRWGVCGTQGGKRGKKRKVSWLANRLPCQAAPMGGGGEKGKKGKKEKGKKKATNGDGD